MKVSFGCKRFGSCSTSKFCRWSWFAHSPRLENNDWREISLTTMCGVEGGRLSADERPWYETSPFLHEGNFLHLKDISCCWSPWIEILSRLQRREMPGFLQEVGYKDLPATWLTNFGHILFNNLSLLTFPKINTVIPGSMVCPTLYLDLI